MVSENERVYGNDGRIEFWMSHLFEASWFSECGFLCTKLYPGESQPEDFQALRSRPLILEIINHCSVQCISCKVVRQSVVSFEELCQSLELRP